MKETHALVLDIGTTGIKGMVFDKDQKVIAKSYKRLNKVFPKRGWVEQSPKEIINKSKAVLEQAVKEAKAPLISFAGLGITNQRETTILWDTKTGKPIYPAIVWEDIRTARHAAKIQKHMGGKVQNLTGLQVDPYFSATKIDWILQNVSQAEKLLAKDCLAFGTVDTWVLWNLSQEKTHATDHTNASRTLLYNIRDLKWDKRLLELFDVPEQILPKVLPSKSTYGHMHSNIVGAPLPIVALCGDQQSSMYAVGNIRGKTKVTYGTGTFIMQVLGPDFRAKSPFFTTLVPNSPKPAYALEAKIDCCGNKVDALLEEGKNLNPTIRKLALQVDEYIKALPKKPKEIVVDGGLTQAKDLVRIQSEISGIPVVKQEVFDGTALGVAKLVQS